MYSERKLLYMVRRLNESNGNDKAYFINAVKDVKEHASIIQGICDEIIDQANSDVVRDYRNDLVDPVYIKCDRESPERAANSAFCELDNVRLMMLNILEYLGVRGMDDYD